MTARLQPARILSGHVIPIADYPIEREPWVELGWPGLDPKLPCLDIFLFDDSGSVTSPAGNDPIGARFKEAENAIRLVADWTMTSRSKIAVLHFDHPAGASGVHALNERHLLRQLSPSLRLPSGGVGTSDLGPSLLAAEDLAANHPGHDVRLTVFSDFELTDNDPSGVISRLRSFPGHVHAVVLGGAPPLDLVDADVTYTPITSQDPPGSFAAALHRSLTATRRARRHSVLHGAGRKELLP